jgi:hypothetical protein
MCQFWLFLQGIDDPWANQFVLHGARTLLLGFMTGGEYKGRHEQ